MRANPSDYLEQCRLTNGPGASNASYGNNGAFFVTGPLGKLMVIASDGGGWEHVSVSVTRPRKAKEARTPTWEEICFVKDLFWEPDETVIQYHPAESEYVNLHSYCLHLWKPVGIELPTPPKMFVGW